MFSVIRFAILLAFLGSAITPATAGIVFEHVQEQAYFSKAGEQKQILSNFKNSDICSIDIREVAPSCGCVLIISYSKHVNAGKSGWIKLLVNSPSSVTQKVDVGFKYTAGGRSYSEFPLSIVTFRTIFMTNPRLLTWERGEALQEKSMDVRLPEDFEIKHIIMDPSSGSLPAFYLRLLSPPFQGFIRLGIKPASTSVESQCKLSIVAESRVNPKAIEACDGFARVF